MSNLTRLAKLRQFRKDQDVSEFLSTEFRQNMLAIEKAFSTTPLATDYLITYIYPLSIANNTYEELVYGNDFRLDPFNLISGNLISVQQEGSYIFDINLDSLFINGDKQISIQCFVNSVSTKTRYIGYQTALTVQIASPFVSIPMSLKQNDKVIFKIYNYSATNSNVATVGSGLLRMSKLEI